MSKAALLYHLQTVGAFRNLEFISPTACIRSSCSSNIRNRFASVRNWSLQRVLACWKAPQPKSISKPVELPSRASNYRKGDPQPKSFTSGIPNPEYECCDHTCLRNFAVPP